MKRFSLALVIVLSLLGYAFTKQQLDQRVVQRKTELDVRYFLPPQYVRLMSFGFELAAADFFWIEGVNYFGSELLAKKPTLQYLKNYTELILHLDPDFQFFYDWSSTAYVYNKLGANRERLIEAIRYANLGIQNMHERRILNPTLLQKGAFNYALEAHEYMQSIPYFLLLGRSSPSHRDMILVASTYAVYAGRSDLASELREEYLGYITFEAQNQDDYRTAIHLLTSPRFNARAGDFIRQLRVQMERDPQLQKAVEKRLEENPILADRQLGPELSPRGGDRLERILQVDIQKNWLPPKLHLLLTL
jgi:hypothetical protein